MAVYDVIIRNGNIYGGGLMLLTDMDIAIKDGEVIMVDKRINASAELEIDARGKLVSPAFIEPHVHMDKMEYTDIQDYKAKVSSLIEGYIEHGVTMIRATVFVETDKNMNILKALGELKQVYRDMIDIKLTVPCGKLTEAEWKEAVEGGLVDYIGGDLGPDNYRKEADLIFAKAEEYGLPIEVHCDRHDKADVSAFVYVTEKVMEYRMQRQVTCDHVTALDAVGIDNYMATDAAVRCARSLVFVTTETSSDMYTSSWKRRGPTRVEKLLECGAGVSIGLDGVRDAGCPYGNCDLLEEAQTTANVHKFATNADLAQLYEMITTQPALCCQVEDYGIIPGNPANIVILDAPDVTEVILSNANKLYVFRNGKLTAQNERIIDTMCRKEQI